MFPFDILAADLFIAAIMGGVAVLIIIWSTRSLLGMIKQKAKEVGEAEEEGSGSNTP